MNSRSLWQSAALALLLSASPLRASVELLPTPPAAPRAADFAEDQDAFNLALGKWKATLKVTTDRAKARALRKAHPATKYAERMQAHLAAGDLRAAEWCLEYLKDLGHKRSDREALRSELYAALLTSTDHAQRERTLERMLKDTMLVRSEGLAGLESMVLEFIANESDPALRGQAMFRLAARFASRGDEPQKAWAEQTLAALLEEAEPANGELAMTLSPALRVEAEKFLFALQHLTVGKLAPDFTGKTIDGEPVALADTRGKITVLDFFGFW